MCSCSTGTKTKIHFFLNLDGNILTENEDIIANIFLSGKPNSENS